MGSKEGINGGLAAVETIENFVPQSVMERQQKRREALRVVQAVSSLAGNEIPILPTPDSESIPRESGVYLFPDYDDPENPIIDTTFEENPRLLSGRADSAHSVLTGVLSSMTQSGEKRVVDVAVKCSLKRTPEERFERAVKELSIMADLYQKGELAFKPIALAVAPDHAPMDGKLVLVSRFDGTINTMDNLPWGRGIDDPSNVEAAIAAAEAVGRFNAVLGYIHKDAKIKNVATSAHPVKTGLIDFETSERIDPTISSVAAGAAHEDFDLLVASLAKKGFFRHPDAKEVLREMADAYLSQWIEYDSRVFDGVNEMVEDSITKVLESRPKYSEDLYSPDQS
jgi:hypothetical protein